MRKVFPISLLFVFLNCKSRSDKVVEEFKKIDEELQRTDDRLDSISQKIRFVGFDEHVADSLERLLNGASLFMRDLRERLDAEDENGERTDVAGRILVGTRAGDSLYNHVMNICGTGMRFGDSSLKQELIFTSGLDKVSWQKKYFQGVPTYAAKTILSKFQNHLFQTRTNIGTKGIGALRDTIISEDQNN